MNRAGNKKDIKPGSKAVGFLSGIWASVHTPFTTNGDVDGAGVRENARRFASEMGLAGIFCNGLIGELWSLSLTERKFILEEALEGAEGTMKVGVVVSAHSLQDTMDLAKHAASVGADHIVLMRPVGFNQPDILERYVEAVAVASDMPIVLFDGGQQTGAFAADSIARLAREGLVAGVKCTRGGDAAESLRVACETPISIVDPYESHWLSNLLRFDLQVLYADPEPLLYQLPGHRLIADYLSAYQRGDLQEALQLFRRLEPLRTLYHRWIMAPLVNGQPVSAIAKRWFGAMGYAAGPIRSPLAALCEEQASQFDRQLATAIRQVYGERITIPAGAPTTWK